MLSPEPGPLPPAITASDASFFLLVHHHPHHDRLRHSGRIHECAEYQDQYQSGDIRAPVQPADSRAATFFTQALSRKYAHNADVLLRTSLHAVEAQSTVEVP